MSLFEQHVCVTSLRMISNGCSRSLHPRWTTDCLKCIHAELPVCARAMFVCACVRSCVHAKHIYLTLSFPNLNSFFYCSGGATEGRDSPSAA